jgi:hypothetical protein
MAYGILKVDTITFTDAGVDKSVTISGLVQNPTFSGNITVTGTVSGNTIQGQTVSGVTVTGTTANFASGVFTTQISGATVTGNVGSFTTITGGTVTLTSGVFGAGSAANPSISFTGDTNTGIYSPGADQVAISTNGTQRLTTDTAAVTSTLPVVHPLGAAATPSLTFTGDLNTGIYSPGADQVAVATSGTGRLFVDASGNVGIGTGTTGNTLTFANNGSIGFAGAIAQFTTNSAYSTGADRYLLSGNEAARYYQQSGAHVWQTAPSGTAGNAVTFTERLRITSAGLVGIGTSSPSSILDVYSISPIVKNQDVAANAANPGIQIQHGGTLNGSWRHDGRLEIGGQDANAKIRLNPDGTVGIGTSTPATVVDIEASADAYITIQPGTTDGNVGLLINNSAGTQKGVILYDTDDNYMLLSTENTERMRIDSAGRVGIGTTSPGSLLSLKPASGGGLEIQDTGGTARAFATLTGSPDFSAKIKTSNYYLDLESAQASGGQGHIRFFTGVTTATQKAAIDSSGRLLVGTSTARSNFYNTTAPAGFLLEGTDAQRRAAVIGADFGGALILGLQKSGAPGGNTIVVNGDGVGEISFQGNDGSEFVACAQIKAEIDNTPGANDMPGRLVFSTTADGAASPTERMRIDSSGRVGIGTASPGSYSAQLAVSGGTLAVVYTESGIELDPQFGFVAGTVRAYDRITSSYKTLGLTGNAVAFGINDVEKARIDSSGRLLVGTSTSSSLAKLVVKGRTSGTNQSGSMLLQSDNTPPGADRGLGDISFADTNGYVGATISSAADGAFTSISHPSRLVFSTTADGASSPTERMRINSGGTLLLNGTAPIDSGVALSIQAADSSHAAEVKVRTNGRNAFEFRNSSNADVGSITVNAASTAYNTSSDYRLKENVTAVTDGINRLQQLKPSRFNFIADSDTTVDGFIAHEVQAVVPEAITGEKDAVDDEGNPEYQGIDQSKLVPLLTAALQEAIAKIETLEGMVAVNNITIDEQQHQLSTLAARLTALESA